MGCLCFVTLMHVWACIDYGSQYYCNTIYLIIIIIIIIIITSIGCQILEIETDKISHLEY